MSRLFVDISRYHTVSFARMKLMQPCIIGNSMYHPIAWGNMRALAQLLPHCCPGGCTMARRLLTDRTLKALEPAPKGKRLDIMDAIVPGFGVRVTDKSDDKGKATQSTFILVARFPGSTNPTRRALGEYGKLSLEQ